MSSLRMGPEITGFSMSIRIMPGIYASIWGFATKVMVVTARKLIDIKVHQALWDRIVTCTLLHTRRNQEHVMKEDFSLNATPYTANGYSPRSLFAGIRSRHCNHAMRYI